MKNSFWIVQVTLDKTQLQKSVKTNSIHFNHLLRSEGQTQPASTQNFGQLVGLNPKNGLGFQHEAGIFF